MNSFKYKGNLRKGRMSKAAKQAFADMRTDDITKCWYDAGFVHSFKDGFKPFIHVILSEEMVLSFD